MPYVNHYSFHILDPEWGHITIKISGHPPFPAQVILNGHEFVACQAHKAGIHFTKEGNCVTHIIDAAAWRRSQTPCPSHGLDHWRRSMAGLILDKLNSSAALRVRRLSQACERWIYTAGLCFA